MHGPNFRTFRREEFRFRRSPKNRLRGDDADVAPEMDTDATSGWGRFSRVPKGADSDPRLTDAQLRVLVGVCEFVDKFGVAFPAVATLAEISCVDRRTIQKARLEEVRIINTERGGKHGCRPDRELQFNPALPI